MKIERSTIEVLIALTAGWFAGLLFAGALVEGAWTERVVVVEECADRPGGRR